MKDILLAILKIFGFLLILPLIIAFTISFQNYVLYLPVNKEAPLLWGAGCYVAFNLFIYNFKDIYDFGKMQVEKLFTFFKPAGYLVPVYSIFLIIVYVLSLLFNRFSWQPFFLFAVAFTLAMHLVLTAHEIYQSDKSTLKSHYLLTFGAVFIANLFVFSLLLAWAVPEYSLVGFVKSLASQSSHLYKSVYKALFVDSSI